MPSSRQRAGRRFRGDGSRFPIDRNHASAPGVSAYSSPSSHATYAASSRLPNPKYGGSGSGTESGSSRYFTAYALTRTACSSSSAPHRAVDGAASPSRSGWWQRIRRQPGSLRRWPLHRVRRRQPWAQQHHATPVSARTRSGHAGRAVHVGPNAVLLAERRMGGVRRGQPAVEHNSGRRRFGCADWWPCQCSARCDVDFRRADRFCNRRWRDGR